MIKFLTTAFFCSLSLFAVAQSVQHTIPAVQPYGKVDMADLEMKSCDFEPDANAEILFDKASLVSSGGVLLQRHVRIKIFNDFGKKAANVRVAYTYYPQYGDISDFKGETISLEDGKVTITPLDKKNANIEKTNNWHYILTFSLPNVKAGSVIEYQYSLYIRDFSAWYFQGNLPTKYSEIQTVFPSSWGVMVVPHVRYPFVVNIGDQDDNKQVKALANVPSFKKEPYNNSISDNLQRMEYLHLSKLANSWPNISNLLLKLPAFGGQFNRTLTGEDEIINEAKKLKTVDEKTAFIFNLVKNRMQWNEITRCYSKDGTVSAWNKKTGNSAEINIIVYHLLKAAGVKAYPIVVSNKNWGRIDPNEPIDAHFDNVLVYIPIDTLKKYVLDATDKFNLYNTIPYNYLDIYGFSLDEDKGEYNFVFLDSVEPVSQSVFLNAAISGDGKMNGTLERTSYAYNKINALRKYKTDGEEKYIKFLCDSNNNIKLQAVKLKDMEVDSLPLTLNANFNVDLGGVTDGYIYFKTNLFMTMGANPFLSENRFSDIDFGYRDNYSVNGIYKIPNGYKIDALPKSVTIVMPDRSIIFKRTVAEDNGTIVIRYMLDHKKSLYFSEVYPDIKDFYKKMYEVLNEQVVLKKM